MVTAGCAANQTCACPTLDEILIVGGDKAASYTTSGPACGTTRVALCTDATGASGCGKTYIDVPVHAEGTCHVELLGGDGAVLAVGDYSISTISGCCSGLLATAIGP